MILIADGHALNVNKYDAWCYRGRFVWLGMQFHEIGDGLLSVHALLMFLDDLADLMLEEGCLSMSMSVYALTDDDH